MIFYKKDAEEEQNNLSLYKQLRRTGKMGSLTEGLENLEIATGSLIERHRMLGQEYRRLQGEYLGLIKTIDQQKEKIEQLEATYKTKENQETLYDKQKDQTNTKQFINEMMREIDHCLLLLDERAETE